MKDFIGMQQIPTLSLVVETSNAKNKTTKTANLKKWNRDNDSQNFGAIYWINWD